MLPGCNCADTVQADRIACSNVMFLSASFGISALVTVISQNIVSIHPDFLDPNQDDTMLLPGCYCAGQLQYLQHYTVTLCLL